MLLHLRSSLVLLLALAFTPTAVRAGTGIAITNSGGVYQLNSITGATQFVGNAGFNDLRSLARDHSGVFWSSYGGGAGVDTSLITIDPATGAGTAAGSVALGGTVRGMAFAPDGLLLAIVDGASAMDELWRVDVSTLSATFVGSTGLGTLQALCVAPYGRILAWDVGTTSTPGKGLVQLDWYNGSYQDIQAATDGDKTIQSLAFDDSGRLFGGRDALFPISETGGQKQPQVGSTHNLDFRGIEFVEGMTTRNGTLGVELDGDVWRVNVATGARWQISSTGAATNCMARDPLTATFLTAFGGGVTQPTNFIAIDPSSGSGTPLGSIQLGGPITALAFNRIGELFGVVDPVSGSPMLWKLDVFNGNGFLVGGTIQSLSALEFGPTDTLYGWDPITGLRRVDPLTGASVDVSTGAGGTSAIQGLAFDTYGKLFGCGTGLYAIDVATGLSSLIGSAGQLDVRGFDAFAGSFLWGAPTIYCQTQTNSQGCGPTITFTGPGFPSVAQPDGFFVDAAEIVPNKHGLLFYGTHGPQQVPYFGGTMCVKGPLERTAVLDSGGSGACTGTFSFDFNAHIASGVDANLQAGVMVDAQYWSRDPAAASTTNLTNAIEFVISP